MKQVCSRLSRFIQVPSILPNRRIVTKRLSTKTNVSVEDIKTAGVVRVWLQNEKKRNALSVKLMKELSECLQEIKESNVRCVVIGAKGPVFSSGHDLTELATKQHDKEALQEVFDTCTNMMTLIRRMPQPVIAQVDGIASAAGCQLVSTCDLAMASPSSAFSTPGVKIGLFCSTPAVALCRSIHTKHAMDMLLTGRLVDAQEAKEMGLISHLSLNPETEALELASEIAKRSKSAVGLGKERFYDQLSLSSVDEAYVVAGEAMVSGMQLEDAEIGINAFLNKKAAEWKHK